MSLTHSSGRARRALTQAIEPLAGFYRAMLCIRGTSVRPSAAAVSAAAMVDGCREEDVADCSSSACTSAATIPVAKLVDIWPPICICMLSGGQLDRWGTPGRRSPLEKDPQTLIHRDCPRRDGFLLRETEWGQTRAQPTQSTPTFPGILTFSAEMAGAKALWLCIQIPG